jgi:hypothetical protein
MSLTLILFLTFIFITLIITYWATLERCGGVLCRGPSHYRMAERRGGGRRLHECRIVPGHCGLDRLFRI